MLNAADRTRLAGIKAGVRRDLAVIDSDPALSPLGRKLAAETIEANARTALRQVTTAAVARTEQQRADTAHRIFGGIASTRPGAELIAYRDAADRARQLEPGDALQAIADAAAAGDVQLEKAIASRAWGLAPVMGGWAAVVSAFAAAHPELSADLQSLAAIEDYQSDKIAKLEDRMAAELGLTAADPHESAPVTA